MNGRSLSAWWIAALLIASLVPPIAVGAASTGEGADRGYRISLPLGMPPVPVPPEKPLTAEKVALGEKLFFEPRLSSTGTITCASCHKPEVSFSDTVPLSGGVEGQLTQVNTPSLLNSAYAPRLLWDGRAFDLEDQVRYPVTHPREMNMTKPKVVELLGSDPEYRRLFTAAFGPGEITFDLVSQALAAFERTLLSGDSPFDRFYFGGNEAALSPAARRGWELFSGKAGCISCHTFSREQPFFTDFGFHNTGVTWERDRPDLGRYSITREKPDRGRFRTPSLRNVAVTAPYMHHGEFQTLAQVIEFYVQGGVSNPYLDENVRPLDLKPEEREDLMRFLESLTGTSNYRRPEPASPAAP